MNFIRVSKATDLPFRPSTLYKWAHLGRFPQIFSKVGGALFVDVEKLESLFEDGRGKTPRPRRGNGDE